MEGNSSLATSLLIKAEKKELDVPLKRKNKLNYSNISSNVLHVPNGYDNLDDGCVSFNESEVENFHTQKDEQQLYRQAEQVLDIINIKCTIIGYTLKLVSILREKQNRQHLLFFLKRFNFKLRHHHLMHGKWHKNTLNEALTTLHHDKELQRFCKTLLQDIDMVNHQGVNVESSSCEIFDMFCRKFCKRRCVTFLAVDGLNFKNEEQSSAIRQMLRCLDKQVVKNVKATDKCFKCGEEGHWANKCKKDIPHDQAWLLKQQCYTCGQYGHFKADCKLHEKASGIKNSGTAGYSKSEVSTF